MLPLFVRRKARILKKCVLFVFLQKHLAVLSLKQGEWYNFLLRNEHKFPCLTQEIVAHLFFNPHQSNVAKWSFLLLLPLRLVQ